MNSLDLCREWSGAERRQRLKAEVVVRFREPLARPLLGLGARSAGTARCGLGLTHMAGAPTLTAPLQSAQHSTVRSVNVTSPSYCSNDESASSRNLYIFQRVALKQGMSRSVGEFTVPLLMVQACVRQFKSVTTVLTPV